MPFNAAYFACGRVLASVDKWCNITFIANAYIFEIYFTIKDNTITYTTTLFGQTLYTKEVQATDIVRVTFKRFNWATRLAVIKTSKGLPIRVALFKPETVFEDLIIFCKDYDVPYTKTKDYQILEKLG